jgi:hypothetical protein
LARAKELWLLTRNKKPVAAWRKPGEAATGFDFDGIRRQRREPFEEPLR